jgi:hypothetical protein
VEQEKSTPLSLRRLEFAGVAAAAATLLCLFVGQEAQQYAAQLTPPATETAKIKPRFNAIDYATTASIKGGTVVIGPCATRNP